MSTHISFAVKFNFTMGDQNSLREGVYTAEAGIRLIRAELDLKPFNEEPGGDVLYKVENPIQFIELLKLAFTISNGGWVQMHPMPEGVLVFPLPSRVPCDEQLVWPVVVPEGDGTFVMQLNNQGG